MKVNKIGILILVIGTVICGSIISNAMQNKVVSKKEVESTFQAAMKASNIGNDYIEHIIITNEYGGRTESYIDRENYLEQSDEYNEEGELMSRTISYDKGAKVISVGENDGEYEAEIMTLDKDLSAYNKELFENESQLENYVHGALEMTRNKDYTQEKMTNSSIVKYLSKEKNFYFDQKDKNFLIKEEFLANGKIYQTIEYKKINKKSIEGQDLFKIDSPVNNESATFLKNIKTSYSDLRKDISVEDAKG